MGEPQMNRSIRRRVAGAAAALALAAPLASCSQGGGGATSCDEGLSELSLAYQPGLGYAPLRLVKAEKLLEEELPGVEITWRELNSGAAIRDGTMSGDIDIAAGGVGPFIIGRGAGVDWKMISGIDAMSLKLMVRDSDVSSLKDLEGDGKIAMPGPDSIQAIVLKKGAKKEFGNSRALDAQVLAMGHPDGVQALSAGQIDAHLTSPPFIQQEVDQGATPIMNSYELFGGPHTFNGVYAKEGFIGCHEEVQAALIESLGRANSMINNKTPEASKVLAKEIGGMEADTVAKELKAEGTKFTTRPINVTKFSDFMYEEEIIKEKLTAEDMFFNNAATKEGN